MVTLTVLLAVTVFLQFIQSYYLMWITHSTLALNGWMLIWLMLLAGVGLVKLGLLLYRRHKMKRLA